MKFGVYACTLLLPYILFGMDDYYPKTKRYPLKRKFEIPDMEVADQISQKIVNGLSVGQDISINNALKLLIRYGKREASMKLIEESGQSSIDCVHEAILYWRDDILKILIKRFPALLARQNYLGTPLHIAGASGNVAAARILLEHGSDVNAPNRYCDTPLHIAAQKGHREMVRFLCDSGANPLLRNRRKFGRSFTPVDIAYRRMLKHGVPKIENQIQLFRDIAHIMLEYFPRHGGSVHICTFDS